MARLAYGLRALCLLMIAAGAVSVAYLTRGFITGMMSSWSGLTFTLAFIGFMLGTASIIIGVGLFRLSPWSHPAALALLGLMATLTAIMTIVGTLMVRTIANTYEGVQMDWWQAYTRSSGPWLTSVLILFISSMRYLSQRDVRDCFAKND